MAIDYVARFWSKVEKTEKCWLWRGAYNHDGYGIGKLGPGSRLAHRISYRLSGGVLQAGHELDHLCRVRHCVNPAHLEPVTHRTNMHRGNGWAGIHARATECPRGHPYDAENTRILRSGGRWCRTCKRNEGRAARAS